MTSGQPHAGSRSGLVILTGTALLWGTIGITVRLLQGEGMSSLAIAFWRFACAVVVLVPVLGRTHLARFGRAMRRPGRLIVVSVSSLLYQLLYYGAVRNVGAGVATLVALGLAPVVLHVVESVSARAVPSVRTLLVLLLALGGLALVTTGASGTEVGPHPVLGLVLAAGCGLAFALSTVWTRPLLHDLTPLTVTFATSVIGLVVVLPAVAVLGWDVPRSGVAIGGTVWLGVVTTAVAYGLFYRGLRSTLGSVAMIVTLLEPVTAVVLAALLLSEPLTAVNVVGGGLLLAAVAALYLRPSSRPDPV